METRWTKPERVSVFLVLFVILPILRLFHLFRFCGSANSLHRLHLRRTIAVVSQKCRPRSDDNFKTEPWRRTSGHYEPNIRSISDILVLFLSAIIGFIVTGVAVVLSSPVSWSP